MAQGNYYANLAHSLSTQDTASVANSISNALEGSTRALEAGYKAGKEANDAFSNLLNTNNTQLGKVLDYFSTKEAKSNIEANKQEQLDKANENVLSQQAEALAEYNTMQNEYINDMTRGATGQSYDDMKANIDSIIKSASGGNMDYDQYIYYRNNPDLIRNAQKFRNTYNNAESTLDELGNIIYSPVDLKVLETMEKLEKDTNFSRLVTKMTDIEAEKERISKGILTDEEFHRVYKDSRENAYKVAGAYDEKSFRDTMNVMSRKDINVAWKSNFNSNISPILWETDPVVAIKKVEEQATNSPISADNVLKNATPKPKQEEKSKPQDDSLQGQLDSQLESLDNQKAILEESRNNPEIKKRQDMLNKQYNDVSDIQESIAKFSNSGELRVFDKSSEVTKGIIGETNDYIYNNLVPNWVKTLGPLISASGGMLNLYSMTELGKYIGEDGKELKGEQAEAAKEADRQAGVKDSDTKEEADKKRSKYREKVNQTLEKIKNADKKELAKKVSKKTGGLLANVGAGALKFFNKAGELSAGLSLVEDNIASAMGIRNLTDGALAPRNRTELDEYYQVWEGKEVSEYVIDNIHLMTKWDLGNSKTFLPGKIEDYKKRLHYINEVEKRLDKSNSVTMIGTFRDTFTNDEARYQINIIRQLLTRQIEMKTLEDKSIAGRIAKIEADKATLTDKYVENIKRKEKFKEVQQEINKTPTTSGNGEKLTELEKEKLNLSSDITNYNKGELVSNLTNGQINNPNLVTDDKYEFALKATANLNDETRNSLNNRNVSVDVMNKEEATIKWAFRDFIFDGSNGTANMQSIDNISKNKEIQTAVQELETIAYSDNWGNLFTSKGKLNKAFENLVSKLDDEFKKNPIRVSSPLSPEEEKEFQHLVNQDFIKKDGLINKTETASRYAFKIMKLKIYQSQADPKHLDMSNNDNLRRFNNSKVLSYLYKYDKAEEIKNKSVDDNYKFKSKKDKFIEAKNRGTSNLYNSITIEKGKSGNKEGTRISINGTKQQAKIDLDRALKIGDISQQQYDNIIKTLTK